MPDDSTTTADSSPADQVDQVDPVNPVDPVDPVDPVGSDPSDLSTHVHDFDFWLGEWDVFGPRGKQVGTNRITALFRTGAIAEHWQGAGLVEGRSLNAYDPMRRCWHQTWVDSTGTLLRLDGNLRDGTMVMEGTALAEDDPRKTERQRITWTPSGDGTEVRQLWEVSADEGASWRVAFDGRYRRRTP